MKKFLVAILTILTVNMANACTSNEIDVNGDGTNCQTVKFTITTINLDANDVFDFLMTAQGTFYVDWGDGTVDTIVRSDTTMTNYSHTYAGGGVKTIRMSGTATGYVLNTRWFDMSPDNDTAVIRFYTGAHSAYMIAAVSGSLGAIFPTLGSADAQQPRFTMTFWGARIQTIPENLFSGVFGGADFMFSGTFYNCEYLTSIPTNLFANITTAHGLFYYTFAICSSLQSIPEDLFKNLSGNGNFLFEGTFRNCPSLTAIPKRLFATVSGAATNMFQRTFNGCTNLSGYIPPSTFEGLIANGAPVGQGMWADTFTDTNIATSCPAGTVQYTTDYDNYWNGHVSCVDASQTCAAGQYLPAHGYECATCPENSYCNGGTYQYSESSTNGITACGAGLYSPAGMWESAQCGHILHVGDASVYLRATKKTTPSVHIKIGNDIFYGNMTTSDVVMHAGSEHKMYVQYNNQTYSVYDDTVTVP